MINIKQAALYSNEVKRDAKPLPSIVWVVIIATVAALIGGKGILGYNVSGLAWFVPLLFSVLVILRDPGKLRFPMLCDGPAAVLTFMVSISRGSPASPSLTPRIRML